MSKGPGLEEQLRGAADLVWFSTPRKLAGTLQDSREHVAFVAFIKRTLLQDSLTALGG